MTSAVVIGRECAIGVWPTWVAGTSTTFSSLEPHAATDFAFIHHSLTTSTSLHSLRIAFTT